MYIYIYQLPEQTVISRPFFKQLFRDHFLNSYFETILHRVIFSNMNIYYTAICYTTLAYIIQNMKCLLVSICIYLFVSILSNIIICIICNYSFVSIICFLFNC